MNFVLLDGDITHSMNKLGFISKNDCEIQVLCLNAIYSSFWGVGCPASRFQASVVREIGTVPPTVLGLAFPASASTPPLDTTRIARNPVHQCTT